MSSLLILSALSVPTYFTFLSGVFIAYPVGVIHLNLLHLPLWCLHCLSCRRYPSQLTSPSSLVSSLLILSALSVPTYFTFLSGVFIVLSCRRYPSQLHLPRWCLHCLSCRRYTSQLTSPSSLVCSLLIMSALSVPTYFTFLSGVFIVLSCRRYPSQLHLPLWCLHCLSCRRYPSQLTSPSSLVSSLLILSALSVPTYFTFLSGVFIVLSCRRYPSQLHLPLWCLHCLSCRRYTSQLTSPSSLVSSLLILSALSVPTYFTFLSGVFIAYPVGVIRPNLLHLPLWCLHCFIVSALSVPTSPSSLVSSLLILSALYISTYFTFLSGVFIAYPVGVIRPNLLHLPLWCLHCLSCRRYPSQLTSPSSLVSSLFYRVGVIRPNFTFLSGVFIAYPVGVIHLNLLHLPLWCLHCLSCRRYPSQLTSPSSLVSSLLILSALSVPTYFTFLSGVFIAYPVGVIRPNLLHLPLWCLHCLSCRRYPSQLTSPSSLVSSLLILSALSVPTYFTFISGVFIAYPVGVIRPNLLHLPLWCLHCLSCRRYPSQLTSPSSLVSSLLILSALSVPTYFTFLSGAFIAYPVGVIRLNLLHLPLWCLHCLSCRRYPSQLTSPSSLVSSLLILSALSVSTYFTFLSGVFIAYPVGVIRLNLLHLPLWCLHCLSCRRYPSQLTSPSFLVSSLLILSALSISTYFTFLSGVFIAYPVGVIRPNLLHIPLWCLHCLSCRRYPSQLTSPSSLVYSLLILSALSVPTSPSSLVSPLLILSALSVPTYFTFLSGVFIAYPVGVIRHNLLHLPLWCLHCLSCRRYPSQLISPSSLVSSLLILSASYVPTYLINLPLWCLHCLSCRRYPSQLISPSSLVSSLLILSALSVSTYFTFLSGVFIAYPVGVIRPNLLHLPLWCLHCLSCRRYPSQLISPSSLVSSLLILSALYVPTYLINLPLWCLHCLSCRRYPSQLISPSSLVSSLLILSALSVSTYFTFLSAVFIAYPVGVIRLNLLHLPLWCLHCYPVGVIRPNLLHLPLWCLHCLSCRRYPSQLTSPSSLVCSLLILSALSVSTYFTFLSGVFIAILSALSVSTYFTFLSGVFIAYPVGVIRPNLLHLPLWCLYCLSCRRYTSQLTSPSCLVCSLLILSALYVPTYFTFLSGVFIAYPVGVIYLNLLHLPLWCLHCYPVGVIRPNLLHLPLWFIAYPVGVIRLNLLHLPLWCLHCLSCRRYPSQLTSPSSLVSSLLILSALSVPTYFTFLSGAFIAYPVGVIRLNLLHLPLWCLHCLSCRRYPSQLTSPSSLVSSLLILSALSVSTYFTFLSGVFIAYPVGVIRLNLLHLPLWCLHCLSCRRYPSQLTSHSSLVSSLLILSALSVTTYFTFLSGVFIAYPVGVIHLNLLHLPLWCIHCLSCRRYPSQLTSHSSLVSSLLILPALSVPTYFTFLSGVFIAYPVGVIGPNLLHLPLWCLHCLSCRRYPSQLISPSSLVSSLLILSASYVPTYLINLPLWCLHCLSCRRYPSQLISPSSLVSSLLILSALSVSTYFTFLSGVFIAYPVGVIRPNLLHLPLWCLHCLSCRRYPSQLISPSSLVSSLLILSALYVPTYLINLPLWCLHCLSCRRYPSQLISPSSLVSSLLILSALSVSTYFTFLSAVFIAYPVGVIRLNLLHLPLWCLHCYPVGVIRPNLLHLPLWCLHCLSCRRYPSQLTSPSSLVCSLLILSALSVSTYFTFLSGVFIAILSALSVSTYFTFLSGVFIAYPVGVIRPNLLHLPLWCLYCLSCRRYTSQLTSPSCLVCSLLILSALYVPTYFTFLSGVFIAYPVGVIYLNLLHLPLWCLHCYPVGVIRPNLLHLPLWYVHCLSCRRYPSQLTSPSSLVSSLLILSALSISTYFTFLSGVFIAYPVGVIHLNLLHLPLWCLHCLSCRRYPSQLISPSSLVSSLLILSASYVPTYLINLPLWCLHCLSCRRYPSQLISPSSLVSSLLILSALSVSTYFTFLSGVFIAYPVGVIRPNLLHLPLWCLHCLSCRRYPSQLISPSSLVSSLLILSALYVPTYLINLPLWCLHCLSCRRYPSQLISPSSLVSSLLILSALSVSTYFTFLSAVFIAYPVGVIRLNLLHLPLWCLHCYPVGVIRPNLLHLPLWCLHCLSCRRYPSQLTSPSSLVCSLLILSALSVSTYFTFLSGVFIAILSALSVSTYFTFLSGVFIAYPVGVIRPNLLHLPLWCLYCLSCRRYTSQLTSPSCLVCSLLILSALYVPTYFTFLSGVFIAYPVGVIYLNLLHLPLWCLHCYPVGVIRPNLLHLPLWFIAYPVGVIRLNLLHLPLWCLHCLSCRRYPSQLTSPSSLVSSLLILSALSVPTYFTFLSGAFIAYPVGVIRLNLLHLPLWCLHCLSCRRYPSQLTSPSSLVSSLLILSALSVSTYFTFLSGVFIAYPVGVIRLNLLHLPLWCLHCLSCRRYPSQLTSHSSLVSSLLILSALSVTTYFTFLSGVFIAYPVGVIHLNLLHLPLWCIHCLSCRRYPSQLTSHSSLVSSLLILPALSVPTYFTFLSGVFIAYPVGVIGPNLLHLPLWCLHCLSCRRYPSQLISPSSLVSSLLILSASYVPTYLINLPLWCLHCLSCRRYPSQLISPSSLVSSLLILSALSVSTYFTFLSGVFIAYPVGVIRPNLLHLPLWCLHCLSCRRYPSQLISPSSLVSSLLILSALYVPTYLINLPLWCLHCLSCRRYPSQLISPSSLVSSLLILSALSVSTYFTFLSAVFIAYPVGVIRLNLLHLPLWCLHCYPVGVIRPNLLHLPLWCLHCLSCRRYPSQLTSPSSLVCSLLILSALSVSTYFTFLSGVFIAILSALSVSTYFTFLSGVFIAYPVGVIRPNLLHLPLWCLYCLSCRRYTSQLTSPSCLVCSLLILSALYVPTYFTFLSGVFIAYPVGVIYLNLLHLPLWCLHCYPVGVIRPNLLHLPLWYVHCLSCRRYPSQLTSPSSLVSSLLILSALSISTYFTFLSGVFIAYPVGVIHLNLLHLPLWCLHCLSCRR